MNNNPVKKCILLFAALIVLIVAGVLSCSTEDDGPVGEPGFGIYLADTGELVLSEHHIKAYHRNVHLTVSEEEDTHAIELNKSGIEKWNSYMTREDAPKLRETLYQRDFIVKVEGKEIYGGKFYSMLSSTTYDGIVILDAVVKLDEERNRIYICNGYVTVPPPSEEDLRNSPEVIDFMDKQGLLK